MSEKDDLRNALIAVASITPYVGGPISFLLDKYIPSEMERRKNEYLKKLENDINELQERIDPENFNKPEFQSVFIRLLRQSREEHRREKIDSFRNISMNLLMTDNGLWQFSKVEFFTGLTLSFIPDELNLLYVFYLLDVKQKLNDLDDKKQDRDIYSIIRKLWSNYDYDYVFSLLMDCTRFNIISGSEKMRKTYNRKGFFTTPLGKEYFDFIFTPIDGNYYEGIK